MATIYGTTGNDAHGTDPAAVLGDGTAGNDIFYTGMGNDYMQATAGADTYNAGYLKSASYWRFGFIDFDTIDYRFAWQSYGFASATGVRIVADLEAGTVRKLTSTGTLLDIDTLRGVDSIRGTAGADTIYGRNFWDYEEFRGYGGNDYIDGRGSFDAVSYVHATTAGITVNLALGTVTSADTGIGSDRLRQIESVIGTNFVDTYRATGFNATSTNRSSFGGENNHFSPLGGADTIVGNGDTVVNYGGVGGAITINLGLQSTLTAAARIRTAYTDLSTSADVYDAGNILASGVNQIRGGNYDDTLIGGGRVNARVAGVGISTVSTDRSFEAFRGAGGNDSIDGKTGYDRADYNVGNQTEGIVVNLAAGTVTGDPLLTGRDTLRGIEVINSTYVDDVYVATGFTLSNAASPSVNRGDVVVTPPAGATLSSRAFNEFRAFGGNDKVTGNGATRVSFSGMSIENLAGTSVIASFTSASGGSARYGLSDGGLGTVAFTGVFAVDGGLGNDSISGAAGFQQLRGQYGNDTLRGGAGNDILYGNDGDLSNLVTVPVLYSDNDSIDGGDGNDRLLGDFGADALLGGVGNDTLSGGLGLDTLAGGAGNDSFRFVRISEGSDTLGDFVRGQDKIAVVAANFGLVSGSAATVVLNGLPTTTTGTFIYSTSSGALKFDADGTGAGVAVQIALLSNKPATLSSTDFVIGT